MKIAMLRPLALAVLLLPLAAIAEQSGVVSGRVTDQTGAPLPGVTIDSWDVVFKPENLAKLKDCGVYFLDASEDMFATALNDF